MACVETNPAGFVKFPRTALRSEWSRKPNCVALFAHLLTRANREPKTWNGITINRGQLVTSREHLVQITGIPLQQLRTALGQLSRAGLTSIVSHTPTSASREGATNELTRGYTLITICDFDSYEGNHSAANPLTNQLNTGKVSSSPARISTTTKEDIRKKISAIVSDLVDPLTDWAEYRQEIGTPLDLHSIIRAEWKKLHDLSGGDPTHAERIVREAISNRWKGLNPIRAAAPATAPAAPVKREYLNPEDFNY